MREKPSLGLVAGEEALDLESLRQLYLNLTGEEPSEAELEEAKAMLGHAKAEDAAKAKP